MIFIHRHEFVRTDRGPMAQRSAPPRRPGRRMRGDRKIELAVVEHLGPNVVIDDSADMLKKLAVDVLRDRSAGLRRVNRRLDGPRLSGTERREKRGYQR